MKGDYYRYLAEVASADRNGRYLLLQMPVPNSCLHKFQHFVLPRAPCCQLTGQNCEGEAKKKKKMLSAFWKFFQIKGWQSVRIMSIPQKRKCLPFCQNVLLAWHLWSLAIRKQKNMACRFENLLHESALWRNFALKIACVIMISDVIRSKFILFALAFFACCLRLGQHASCNASLC